MLLMKDHCSCVVDERSLLMCCELKGLVVKSIPNANRHALYNEQWRCDETCIICIMKILYFMKWEIRAGSGSRNRRSLRREDLFSSQRLL